MVAMDVDGARVRVGRWVLMVGLWLSGQPGPDPSEYIALKLLLQKAQRLGGRLASTSTPCVVFAGCNGLRPEW